MHRVLFPDLEPDAAGNTVFLDGDEAHHAARVKRLLPGEPVELLSGRGLIGSGEHIESVKLGKHASRGRGQKLGWGIRIRVDGVRAVEPVRPALSVRTAVPKGPRLEAMIDQLSQIGAASWGSLGSERSVIDPRAGKRARLERACMESAKQCGRAWTLTIDPATDLAGALTGVTVIVADASGEPYRPVGDESIRLVVGPEGGWSGRELAQIREAGTRICAFGTHVMRIETAAAAAAAIVLDRERLPGGR